MTGGKQTQVRVQDISIGFDDEEEAILHAYPPSRTLRSCLNSRSSAS